MNQSVLNIGPPYQDELLYSVLARYRKCMGIQSPKRLLRTVLANTAMSATPDLQSQIGRLRELIEIKWGRSLGKVVWETTLLPYYCAFTDVDYRMQMIRDASKLTRSDLHTRLGICASRVHKPFVLRTCALCIQSDLEKYGSTYWHRAHQLPGVLVCPVHGEPLIRTAVAYRPHEKHEYIAATPDLRCGELERETVHDAHHERLWEISRESADLLSTQVESLPQSTRATVINQLELNGYDNRRGALDRLVDDFRQFYGADLLMVVEPQYQRDQPIPWLKEIRRQWRNKLHPMRHVLLKIFLSHCASPIAKSYHANKAWPCLNWHADHYREPVVTTVESIPLKSPHHPQTIRLSCDCGFVYTQRVDCVDRYQPYRIVRYGQLFESQAQELKLAGYTTGTIARVLGVEWATADKLACVTGISDPDSGCGPKLSEDQQDWLNLRITYPEEGAKSLCSREPALHARLYRSNRQWLVEHAPSRTLHKSNSRRINWDVRDDALAIRVLEIAKMLYDTLPLRRVTRTSIAKRLGLQATIEKCQDKLPKTYQAFTEVCESIQAFQIRRSKYVLEQAGGSMPTWELLRVVGLRQSVINESFLQNARLQRVVINEVNAYLMSSGVTK